jgi:PAS domain S-box-containing protein
MDRDLRFIQINDTLAEMNGIPAKEHLGKTVGEVLPKLAAGVEPFIRKVLATGEPVLNIEVSGETPKQPGVQRHWLESFFPIPGASGRVEWVGAIVVEITGRKQTEQALRDSEELFRSLSASSPIGIFMADAAGRNVYSNPRCREMLGLGLTEIAGEGWSRAVHPDDRERVAREWSEAVRDGKDWSAEHRIITPAGIHRWLHVRTAPMRSEGGELTGYVGTVEDITAGRNAAAELEASRRALRALAASSRAAREEERTRIARLVHDELGHAFTDLKFDLAWMDRRLKEKSAPDRSGVRRRISTMIKRVEADLDVARRIASELRPAMLDALGLVPAVEWEARQFGDRSGIGCRLDVPDGFPAVDAGRSTALFRILQELLVNVARHAKASHVRVRLAATRGRIELEVTDNGRGITAEQAAGPNAMGLLNVRERAAEFGGAVAIHGAPGEGTSVRVTLPLTPP